jgi:hypothetical protein
MYSHGRRGVVAALALLGSGCSITGAWRVESVEPESARAAFPLHRVTFHEDGTYADEPTGEGEGEPTIGQYSWNPAFYTLHLTPQGTTTQFYTGYMQMDGKLILDRTGAGPEVRATLAREPVEDPAEP